MIEGREERLTPLAGAAILRELDERLGVTEALAAKLGVPHETCKVQHSMTEIRRTLTYTMAAERTVQSATEHLRDDPVMRFTPSDRRGLSPLCPRAPCTTGGVNRAQRAGRRLTRG